MSDGLEVGQTDLGHRRHRSRRLVDGRDRLDLGQRGWRDRLGRVEFLDVGEGGDLEQVAVLLGRQTLGPQLQPDGGQDGVLGAGAGGEVQAPLPHVEPVGDGGQGDSGKVGDELLELVALPVGDLTGQQHDLGGPGVWGGTGDAGVVQVGGAVGGHGFAVEVGSVEQVLQDPTD